MSFMDKVKAQAESAVAKGQSAVKEGQSKIDEIQAKKARDALLRDLGEAYYAAQRSGGSTTTVDEIMAKIDAADADPS